MAPIWDKFESKIKIRRRAAPPEPTSMSSRTKPDLVPQSTSNNLSIQERLWNKAYDNLKASDAKAVETYEKLLSTELHKTGFGVNRIGQGLETRSLQMQQLVQLGLERTQKISRIKGLISDGLEVVDALKGIMDEAVNASAEASVAWVGVCFGLEILTNPVKEAATNRSGIAYVISRMNWYWDLAGMLLGENTIQKSSAGLRARLEEHIIELYQKLLLFQIKCACLYYQNQGVVLLKDVLKLDDWESQVKDIKDAEAAVHKDSEQYNSEQVKSHLHDLAATAHSLETILGDVFSAIQNNAKQQERRHEDDKNKECLRDIYLTDPREDKISIEDTRGGLLRDSYRWILDHPDFQRFRSDPQNRLLWIKGDPGKGKTMLLCGIIDEIEKESASLVSYFFCQATKVQLSDATSVLRGLIFLLVIQQPSLVSWIRTKYDIVGSKLFEGINVWVSMTEILTNMLKDPELGDVILIVDALDECMTNRPQLLDFIAKETSRDSRAKWIVSSRNWPDIEEQLADASNIRVQLELNSESISDAVHTFIQYKVDQLTRDKKYDTETSTAVKHHLLSNAHGTFLWVALVCQVLADPRVRKWQTITKLKSFPPGLDALYKRMLVYIFDLDDANLCKEILAIVSTVYRPITLEELKKLVQSLEEFDSDDLEEVIALCGSFLTVRDGVILFVHQSAKDYLVDKAADEIFSSGIPRQHRDLVSRSIEVLLRTLRRDIYDLRNPGVLNEEVLCPSPDPLASVRYPCVFWVDHLSDSHVTQLGEDDEMLQDGGNVHRFFQKSYLHWLESLSLLGSIPVGIRAVRKLESLIGVTRWQQLQRLVRDAHRFILAHGNAVKIAPLQVYTSAIVFSPTNSLIRQLFEGEEQNWIKSRPKVDAHWGTHVLTLEGHGGWIYSVAFSADGNRIVSTSPGLSASSRTIRVWDRSTGDCITELEDRYSIKSVALLTKEGDQIASISMDAALRIWNVNTGTCMSTLESNLRSRFLAAFSGDGNRLVVVSDYHTLHIWDVTNSKYVTSFKGHRREITSVAVSKDGQRVITGSRDCTCKVWDIMSRACISTLKGNTALVESVDLSMDGERAVSMSLGDTIKIWDASTGACLSTTQCQKMSVKSVAISWDGQRFATGFGNGIVEIRSAATGVGLSRFKGHSESITTVSFSPDGRWLLTGSFDRTIKLWDVSIDMSYLTFSSPTRSLVLSLDGQRAVTESMDRTIMVWNTATGERKAILKGHFGEVHSMVFSADGLLLASALHDGTTKIWDVTTGACKLTLYDDDDNEDESDYFNENSNRDDDEWSDEDSEYDDGDIDYEVNSGDVVSCVAFSTDGQQIASGFSNGTVKLRSLLTRKCTSTFGNRGRRVSSVAFSMDDKRIASNFNGLLIESMDGNIFASDLEHGSIEIRDVVTNAHISTIEHNSPLIYALAFSADGTQLASSSGTTVKIWNVATCACTATLKVGKLISRLAFDPIAESRLLTNCGTLDFIISSMADESTTEASSLGFVQRGYGISSDYTWITKDGNRILWIPAEYRSQITDVMGSTVAMSIDSNRMMVMQFS